MEKYIYRAKLDRVVDGDTVDAMIDCGFSIFRKERVRLYGINAPESRTRDKQEKKKGLAVGDTYEEKIDNVEFGRIAAQTTKQVIVQKVREA